ncbi:terpenoid synthase [Imleria badia]|nr:terpenoid synthase [Imleria badia]
MQLVRERLSKISFVNACESQIHAARENIHLLLEQCNIPYEVIPFDKELYQECIDDAMGRGYPVDGDKSVRTFLREGVVYAANAGAHLPHRPTQLWIVLYMSCAIFVDETINYFSEEMPNIYLFSDWFIHKEPQGNGVLDTFADIIRRALNLYPPVASHLIITLTLNFVTANLLEHKMRSMKIFLAAQGYPTYQRILSGLVGAYGFMAFLPEIPLTDYIQAIPETLLFINNVNDIFSFYKEEQVGETTNHISMLAACTSKKSKSEALGELTEAAICHYKCIIKILEGSQEACEAFKQYAAGYVYFHTSSGRYQLEDLGL